MIELVENDSVLALVSRDEITALTERATRSTFYSGDLTPEQIAANERVTRIAADTVVAAARNPNQYCVAALVDGSVAGYMIATIHAESDRELDWMMVDPRFQGSGVADALLQAGLDWLGGDRPLWLNVIRDNERAIRFYRKHGFAVDPDARTSHVVPHLIMRRAAA